MQRKVCFGDLDCLRCPRPRSTARCLALRVFIGAPMNVVPPPSKNGECTRVVVQKYFTKQQSTLWARGLNACRGALMHACTIASREAKMRPHHREGTACNQAPEKPPTPITLNHLLLRPMLPAAGCGWSPKNRYAAHLATQQSAQNQTSRPPRRRT
jgi:hypothetical protein